MNKKSSSVGRADYDTHVHTTFSPDGQSPIEDYIAAIDSGRARGIGFTEHLDFLPECGAYRYLDTDNYFKKIQRYREMGYELYAGAEVDYAESVGQEILDTLEQKHFDYTICSIHMINGFSISDGRHTEAFAEVESARDIVEKYYRELISGIRVKEFDVIGHIGIFKRGLEKDHFEKNGLKGRLDELNDETARICAASGKILEVNSSGLFSTIEAPLPDSDFLKAYFQYGGRTVSMGSDAHNVANLCRGFEKVAEILKAVGFKYTFLPWDRENGIKL